MRHYELVTILSPMLNQDDASATWDEIKTFITNREGEITAEQTWGTRRLAYPIRKGNYNFLEGAYYLSTFTAENPFNRELENYLRLHDNVLRSLVIRCDGPLADKPAPGPLTAPSRYIPPGRGRRNDGGGPIPEAPAPAAERGAAPAANPSSRRPRSNCSPGPGRCARPAGRGCLRGCQRTCSSAGRCSRSSCHARLLPMLRWLRRRSRLQHPSRPLPRKHRLLPRKRRPLRKHRPLLRKRRPLLRKRRPPLRKRRPLLRKRRPSSRQPQPPASPRPPLLPKPDSSAYPLRPNQQ